MPYNTGNNDYFSKILVNSQSDVSSNDKMNSDQIDIVIQYLKIETNYAVIINGQYGVGKTHFYKNELDPKIKETSLAKDDRKKFTPIHISLFGFKSLEEIQSYA